MSHVGRSPSPSSADTRLALKASLVSPHFLFRVERDQKLKGEETAHFVSQYELASRLSYFLWSSMPDEELFRLAGERKLRKPDVLAAEVRRMLQDPKSVAPEGEPTHPAVRFDHNGTARPEVPEPDRPIQACRADFTAVGPEGELGDPLRVH